MQKARIAAALAALPLSILPITGASPADASANSATDIDGRSSCTPVALYGIRGSGQGPIAGPTIGFGPQASTTAKAIIKALPLGKVRTYSNGYPAVSASLPHLAGNAYWSSVKDGVANTRLFVARMRNACPRTKIVIIGYSQGAQVAHYAATAMTSAQASHVSAVVLLADPLRDLRDSRVALQWWGGLGAFNGSLYTPRQARMPIHMAGRVVSPCYVRDRVCNNNQHAGAAMAAAVLTAYHSEPYKRSNLGATTARWVLKRL